MKFSFLSSPLSSSFVFLVGGELEGIMDRVWKANIDVTPSCPRCGSSNTKFCYYNNYSLTQPRYFCKGCRRYWTKGGSLRNVPVGGGCRKNRRSRSIRVSTAEAGSRVSLGYCSGGNGRVMTGKCFESINTGWSASPDGSHIDLAIVYANYLNQKPDSTGEPEIEEAGEGFYNQFPSNEDNPVEPSIEILSRNDLLGCEFLSNLFSDNNMTTEQQVYHQGFAAADITLNKSQGCDVIDECAYSLPPLPNEEVASWLESPDEMSTHGFHEQEFLPAVFELDGHDPSFIIANWREFDLPLDDALRK